VFAFVYEKIEEHLSSFAAVVMTSCLRNGWCRQTTDSRFPVSVAKCGHLLWWTVCFNLCHFWL